MENVLYVAAEDGNIEILQNTQSNEFLIKKTHEKNNIIHIAVRNEQHEFIVACLERFGDNYELICEGNSQKNTPIHVAAEVGNISIVKLLYNYLETRSGDDKPWRKQNLEGNTSVHVALINHNVKIAKFLLEKDPYLATIVNDFKEAPLHLAIKHVNHYRLTGNQVDNGLENESILAKIKEPIHKGGANLEIKVAPEEDMSSIIHFLVEKWSFVTCWPDVNGSTPLHSAASLSIPYNLQLIRLILEHYSQSAEVCDSFGNSILHLLINRMPYYKAGKKLFEFRSIYNLRNSQDRHGNTPLHIAVRDSDTDMIQVLLESSTKLSIKNKEGISVASLIHQQNVLKMLRKRKFTEEEYKAASSGNITILRETLFKLGPGFLLSRDSKGRNILHILMNIQNGSLIVKHDFFEFVKLALDYLPTLVCQIDHNEDTPIHVLMRNDHRNVIHYVNSDGQDNPQADNHGHILCTALEPTFLPVLLEECNWCILRIIDDETMQCNNPPWLVQNAQGNTPLHEALIAKNYGSMRKLLEHELARTAEKTNQCNQTPLHLIAASPKTHETRTAMMSLQKEDIKLVAGASYYPYSVRDKDGLTPLERAVHAGNLLAAEIMCSVYSPLVGIERETNGKTIWKMFVKDPSDKFVAKFLRKNRALRADLSLQDEKGDTPLHLVIQDNRYDLLQHFLIVWQNEGKRPWLPNLLDIENKAGETPGDLIGELPTLPCKIEEFILDHTELMGIRSAWGIPKSQLQSYMNSMNVIAALLTTITFTAAFSVPGGLLQDKGTPVLIKIAAFQVFIISDVIAMCLSMMVLFCLLWIMATSNKRDSVMIQDFSVSLLLAAFFATILTFMTGVYATIFTVKPWIAIMTLVLCLLLMMLVHKYIVVRLLIPFRKTALIFGRKFLRPLC